MGDAESHISQCIYRKIVCPNMCKGRDGKEIKILQKDVQKHLEKECQRRLFKCPHCKEKGEHHYITGSHKETCQHIRIDCTNEGCRESVRRMDLNKHKLTCPHEKINCKFEPLGCKTVLRRQEMEKHEGIVDVHLTMAMDGAVKQNERIKSLESQLIRVTSKNDGKFTFRMPSFNQHKTSASLFFSPSFYTSQGGYKMCIRVVANGDGQGKETHISVYAVVMKGDYDDNVDWPIRGIVTVELLNHLQDRNHHAIRFTYPDGKGDVSTQRVMQGDRAKRGYGKTRFIAYTDLGFNREKNCQFLKDDCLYFRVNVETPNPKPWLSCSI